MQRVRDCEGRLGATERGLREEGLTDEEIEVCGAFIKCVIGIQ